MLRLLREDQDQDFFCKNKIETKTYFKTKTIFHVLEVPGDQDQGLETTTLPAPHHHGANDLRMVQLMPLPTHGLLLY